MVLSKEDMQANGTSQDLNMSTHNFSHLIFDKQVNNISKKKESSRNNTRKLNYHIQNNVVNMYLPYLSPCTKININ